MLDISYISDRIGWFTKVNSILFATNSADYSIQQWMEIVPDTKISFLSEDPDVLEDLELRFGERISNLFLLENENLSHAEGFRGKESSLIDPGDHEVLVFDSTIRMVDVVGVCELKSRAVVGEMSGKTDEYFTLWESLRGTAERVFLVVSTQYGKVEVVDWEKGDRDIDLSIVLPVYNVEQYLAECIDSLLVWSAEYFEIIAVNDGSTDGSLEILQSYAERDPRIRILDKPNGGCASARQAGLDAAAGRYVGFVDPDDFTEPEMFFLLLRRALLGGYDVAYSGYSEYFESDGTVNPIENDAIFDPYSRGTRRADMIQRCIIDLRIGIWRGIYRREFLRQNSIQFNTSLERFDDLPFKVEVFAKARSTASVPGFLYYYRLERPDQDVAVRDDRLFVHFDIFTHLDVSMREMHDQRLLDLLQIVKLDTHTWGYLRISGECRDEYRKRMWSDILQNMGVIRTFLVAWRYRSIRYAVKRSLNLLIGLKK